MKRFRFILILSIIFTGYLFSQVEENEIIKVDTVINIDSIVVTKVDTTIVEEPVNSLDTVNTFAINDCKKIGIISAKAECTLFFIGGSVIWNMPLYSNITFAAKYLLGGDGTSASGTSSCFGLGLGYVNRRSDNIILRVNIYPILWTEYHKYANTTSIYGLNIGGDIIFWNIFSIGLDAIGVKDRNRITGGMLFNMGLNIVY